MHGDAIATPQRDRTLFWYALAAVAVALGYTLYTGQIWEDYFITFRFSKNLIEGRGLVYNPGERVHGFTSPIGVLLPAACYALTGAHSYLHALWMFRLACIAGYAGGGVILVRALRRAQATKVAVTFAGLFYLLDVKAVAFSTNGMETAFMLLCCAWGIELFRQEAEREPWLARGLCWAGFMWTRPDGFVYIATLALASLLFATGKRGRRLIWLVVSGLICAWLYAPWVAWASYYYGSPVPNTVLAKAAYRAGSYQSYLWELLRNPLVAYYGRALRSLAPIYYGPGEGPGAWPQWMGYFSLAANLFANLYWLLPVRDRMGRMASFCFTCLFGYTLLMVATFPWYIPPVSFFGWVALSLGVVTLGRLAMPKFPAAPALAALLLALAAGMASVIFVMQSWQIRAQQELIEDANRTRMGLWIKEHAHPTDLLLLESLGYIGYFSEIRVADYPGLVSPEVVRLNRQGVKYPSMVELLKPDWIAARPHEAAALLSEPYVEKNYRVVQRFDVTQKMPSYGYIPGRDYLMLDAIFFVLHREPHASRKSNG